MSPSQKSSSLPGEISSRERDTLRITEIFFSIQGESSHAGRPCTFIRLSRCNLRCTWCDTTYSFTGGTRMSLDAIMAQVEDFGCNVVELTGGEPLLQPLALPLMERLCDEGYEVLIETSGSLDISGIDERVHIIMDLKAPGSGEVEKNRYENLKYIKETDELKIVILDETDFQWALEVLEKYELLPKYQVIFSPVHGELDPGELGRWILKAGIDVRLGLQIHKYLALP